jgi:multicomponent Na+:H+ antiporter subunit D
MIAPYPVSALLHAVAVVKAGLFCIFKIIIYIFGFDYLQSLVSYFDWPIYLACFTMLFAGYKAVTHDSIKNILAYSTISQLSLVLISAFLFIESSMIAAITQMIAHSLAKIVLFFAAGRFYAATKFSHLSQMKGLGIKLITPTIFFIFASLSLIGIPPFIGYYSKSIIIESVRYHEYGALIKGVIYLASALSAIYLFKIIYYLFSESEEELYIPSIDENSIFNKFHKANNYGMDIAIALCCILMMTFPIINNFLHSLLWSVL